MKPQIEVIHGDITTMHVDVIVNAANPSLMGEAVWTGLSTGLQDRSCWKPAKPYGNSRANVLPAMRSLRLRAICLPKR